MRVPFIAPYIDKRKARNFRRQESRSVKPNKCVRYFSSMVMVQIELGKLKRPQLRRFGTWFVTTAACYKRLKENTLVFLFFYLLPLFPNDHKFCLWEGFSRADLGAFPLIADTIVTLLPELFSKWTRFSEITT